MILFELTSTLKVSDFAVCCADPALQDLTILPNVVREFAERSICFDDGRNAKDYTRFVQLQKK